MTERYAIFYAPPIDSALWSRACQWLGRDAASGGVLDQPAINGFSAEGMRDMTHAARRYGFHATLKAPIMLANGAESASLVDAVDAFSDRQPPVVLGKLEVQSLNGFLALMPARPSTALQDFAARCVAEFELFRAPLDKADREQRIKAGLTRRQIDLLDQYGYPYVMDEFRFHMTLTDRLDAETGRHMAEAAESWFADTIADPVVIDRIALFHEPGPGEPFLRVADFLLSGSEGQ